MADDESTGTEMSATTGAPPCPKCEAAMFATTRWMRTHELNMTSARPIVRDHDVPVWRCMRCTNELPREV